jgi:hypothetical protein
VLRVDGKVSADGTMTCKTKLKKRDRKDPMAQVLVCHPLLKEAERVMLGLPPLPPTPAAAAAPAAAEPAVYATHVATAAPAAAPAVVAAASAVVAAAPARGGKRKGRGSGAAPRARKPPAAEVEAATRAFQNEGSSAESDSDEGYGDMLQKRAEMKKRRAAQK